MPRKPVTPEQREETRQRLRRAAGEVYNENGVHGVSVRAVAERAGVSTGTLYRYFEGLDDLMRSLWTAPVARWNQRLEEVAKANPNPIRRLRALFETYARFAIEEHEVYRGTLLFVRPQRLPKPERRPLREFAFYELVSHALREGQARGQVRRGNVDLLAQTCWAALHGTAAIPINLDRAAFAPPEELFRATIRNLLRSLEP